MTRARLWWVVAAVAMVIAGCGGGSDDGPDVATLAAEPAGSGEVAAAGSTAGDGVGNADADADGEISQDEAQDVLLDYSACMREEGLVEFPDLNAQGAGGPGRREQFEAAGIDRRSETFETADAVCRPLLDELIESRRPERSPEEEAQLQADLVAVAVCMRTNGVPGFPDPDFSQGTGRQAFRAALEDADIELDRGELRQQLQECRSQVGVAGPGGGPNGGLGGRAGGASADGEGGSS